MNISSKTKFIILGLFVPGLLGAFSLAEKNFTTLVGEVLSLIDLLTPILFGLAFIVFFWGLSKFILNANKPEEIKNGRTYMIWGILALFVLITWKSIVGLISNELEIGSSKPGVPLLRTDAKSLEK